MAPASILISGGTGALGTAVVRQLLDIFPGAHMHIPCMNPSELRHWPAELTQNPQIRLHTGVDLTDEPAVEHLFAAAAQSGPLLASIHIAGGFAYHPTPSVSKADFLLQMQMNALTCFLCCREAVKSMRSTATRGRIVNVAARPALEPRLGANMVPYTMAKSAVAALTQALAEEVAADGIWINAVVPSIMDTPANRAAMPTANHAAWAKVDDVARTIAFLAGPTNTCTRGGLVPVYGTA